MSLASRGPVLAGLIATLMLAGVLLAGCNGSHATAQFSDYERELAQIDATLVVLARQPDDAGAATRRAALLYRRALLTAEPAGYGAAQAVLTAMSASAQSQQVHDVRLLLAKLDATLHRNDDARNVLAQDPVLAGQADALALDGDIAVQQGRYTQAQESYATLAQQLPLSELLVRLAWLAACRGEIDAAQHDFELAEDELTAKDMRAFAWIEVQRGQLEFRRGRYDAAQAHYDRADAAYSGYWLVAENRAELAAARGDFAGAIALYENVAARSTRPETAQALGDLYRFAGDPLRAGPWHERALAVYRASAARGEVHYLHQLTTFYADAREDGPQAVVWARRDLQQRHDVAAHEALAWALFRDNQFAAAQTEMQQAAPFAIADAHVLAHAAMIDFALGATDAGKRQLAQAAAVNPNFQAFHVHH